MKNSKIWLLLKVSLNFWEQLNKTKNVLLLSAMQKQKILTIISHMMATFAAIIIKTILLSKKSKSEQPLNFDCKIFYD